MTALVCAVVVFLVSILKGAVAFGFPTIATPVLALILPVKTVVALVLGCFVLLFVVLNATALSPRVPLAWERWLSPPIGFLAGVVGGVTNVPGRPLVVYYYALGMEKYEFVRSVALSFAVYKLVQLGALIGYGAFPWRLVPAGLALTVTGFGGFFIGLEVQDRLDQRTFNRANLVLLAALGTWLVIRAAH